MAYIHSCRLLASPQCRRQVAGKPRRKTCEVCGSEWFVQQGTWHVLAHRGDGRYSADDAVASYEAPSRAHAALVQYNHYYHQDRPPRGYVVRFLT